MPSDKNIVLEARELADDLRFDIQPLVRSLLHTLADEVERQLETEERYNEAVSSGLILDEDHHD